jgi:hypothetical protein
LTRGVEGVVGGENDRVRLGKAVAKAVGRAISDLERPDANVTTAVNVGGSGRSVSASSASAGHPPQRTTQREERPFGGRQA